MSLSFGHIETHVKFNDESVEEKTQQFIKMLNQKKVDTSDVHFEDVMANDPKPVRIHKGLINEAATREILTRYGIAHKKSSKKQDTEEKIDFFIDDLRLSVQYKGRNINKNSLKNDLGVEYCRIKNNNGLSVELGRDRHSIADVYICMDTQTRTWHVVPNKIIDQGCRAIHDNFVITVSLKSMTFTGPNGSITTRDIKKINAKKKSTGEIFYGRDGVMIKDNNIGEIRYFTPKKEEEGMYKSICYFNAKFTENYEFKL